jgi:hypothetical protein
MEQKEKSPAFLFYSKDFYEGTRTMLPKERACLVDLMIYQQQHGPIPKDYERMVMYCSGCDEATLMATLKAKFRETEHGWINGKMEKVSRGREDYLDAQSINGRIGQFWKKVKALVNAKELKELKSVVYDEIGKEKFSEMLTDSKATLEGLLEGLRKHIANAIEDESVDEVVSLKKDARVFFENDEALNQTYLTYLKVRKEKGVKTTPTTIEAQVKKFSALPRDHVIWGLNQSIENGWTGCWPEKYAAAHANNHHNKQPEKPIRPWNQPDWNPNQQQ